MVDMETTIFKGSMPDLESWPMAFQKFTSVAGSVNFCSTATFVPLVAVVVVVVVENNADANLSVI